MKVSELTLEKELAALDELSGQNENHGEDVRNALNERRTEIRRLIAHQRVDEMLFERLGLEADPVEPTVAQPTINIQPPLPFEGPTE